MDWKSESTAEKTNKNMITDKYIWMYKKESYKLTSQVQLSVILWNLLKTIIFVWLEIQPRQKGCRVHSKLLFQGGGRRSIKKACMHNRFEERTSSYVCFVVINKPPSTETRLTWPALLLLFFIWVCCSATFLWFASKTLHLTMLNQNGRHDRRNLSPDSWCLKPFRRLGSSWASEITSHEP